MVVLKNKKGVHPGMESDMTVETFKRSFGMRVVDYRSTIGVGNTSVYVKVRGKRFLWT